MIDQQHRDVEALAHRAQQLGQVLGLTGVEACCRLVQQHELWTHGDGAPQLHTALDSGRQITRQPVDEGIQLEHVKDRPCTLRCRPLGVVRERQAERIAQGVAVARRIDRKLEILEHRHRVPELQVLESSGDATPRTLVGGSKTQ